MYNQACCRVSLTENLSVASTERISIIRSIAAFQGEINICTVYDGLQSCENEHHQLHSALSRLLLRMLRVLG